MQKKQININKLNENEVQEQKLKEEKLIKEIKVEKIEKSKKKDIYRTKDINLFKITQKIHYNSNLNTSFKNPRFTFSIKQTEDIELSKSIESKTFNVNLNIDINPEIIEKLQKKFNIRQTKDLWLIEYVKTSGFNSNLNTDFVKSELNFKIYKTKDIELHTNIEGKSMTMDMSTEIKEIKRETLEDILENILSESSSTSSLLEEILNVKEDENKREGFPKAFSEGMDNPIIVIIEEKNREWHMPVLYVLKELYRETNEEFPKIVYRLPETSEEGEKGYSFNPHQLDTFSFEREIEVLNFKTWRYPFNDFINYLEGVLKTAFLKRTGFLLIVVKEDKDIKNKLKNLAKGIRIYTFSPKDENYNLFCSLITGVKEGEDFFKKLKIYNRYLNLAYKWFSVFVDRDVSETGEYKDKYQYPYKIIAVLCLTEDLININRENTENLEDKILKVLSEDIKVETEICNKKPDIVFKTRDDKKIVIEIETLISTIEPLKKIDETVKKYKECEEKFNEIWIVIRPVSAFLHYADLLRRKRILKKMVQKEIRFLVPILEGRQWKLVEMELWRNIENWSKSGRIILKKK